jgi:N-acetylneuraminic acid mutarotase
MPWSQAPSLNYPHFNLAAATANAPAPGSGSAIYAIGGNGGSSVTSTPGSTVEVYDTATKTWSLTASIPSPLRTGSAAASVAGKLHLLGGFDPSSTPLANHDVFDPATGTWSSLAPLLTARAHLAAVTGPDGLIYAIGGNGSGDPLTTVEAYDPAHDTWATVAALQTPRTALGAAAAGGSIYAIGGFTGSSVIVSSVEIFDIATTSWTPGPQSLPLPTAWHATAVGPNGLIYVIGGMQQQPGQGAQAFVANVYSYDPAASVPAWVQQVPMPDIRAGLAAATGPDGLVYAISGITCPGQQPSVEVDAYTYDKCDYIEYELGLATQQMAAAQASLDGGDLTPQQRAAGEKALAGLRGEILGLEKSLQACRG